MIEKEITQAKQCALTTKDWDTYQIIVRTCLTPEKSSRDENINNKQATTHTVKQGNKTMPRTHH